MKNDNELKKFSYWLSQLFLIAATIIGVFFAASQGYRQAINFENNKSYKEIYYLQKSLQYELQDNINLLNEYIKKAQDPSYLNAKAADLNFYQLVWQNMQYSPDTLGTPPEILRLSQQFYAQTNSVHNKIANNQISLAVGIKELNAIIKKAETDLIPALEKNTKEIQNILQDSGIIL